MAGPRCEGRCRPRDASPHTRAHRTRVRVSGAPSKLADPQSPSRAVGSSSRPSPHGRTAQSRQYKRRSGYSATSVRAGSTRAARRAGSMPPLARWSAAPRSRRRSQRDRRVARHTESRRGSAPREPDSQAHDESRACDDDGMTHHEREDVTARRAEREPGAVLARPTAHTIRHHGVDAYRRQHQRHERKAAEQSHRQPRNRRGFSRDVVERTRAVQHRIGLNRA